MEFGEPIEVLTEYVEMFKQGEEQKRDAVAKFLAVIHQGLRAVSVLAQDETTLRVSAILEAWFTFLTRAFKLAKETRRLYVPPGQHLPLGQVVDLDKRLLVWYEKFGDEPRVRQLREHVGKYHRLVRDIGLKDYHVRHVAGCSRFSSNHPYNHIGPTRREVVLENPSPPTISTLSGARLHSFSSSRHNFECSFLDSLEYNTEKEGKRRGQCYFF